jgi:hypothetical protein
VILFLKSIDANTAELTAGATARWPRNYRGEYSSILERASAETITGLVNEILRIGSKTDINERIDILKSWLDSSDSLLNLVALQYALSSQIWPKGLSPDYQTGITKANMRKQLSGYAFKLIQSDSPSIQRESIRLLGYADPQQALPILIDKITDPNKGVRIATVVELRSIMRRLHIGEGFDYDSNSPPEELVPVQRKWQEWYDNTDFDE